MYIGERIKKDGKLIEITDVFGSNYAFKEVTEETKVDIPVFEDPEEEPKKETKEEEKPVVRRGRKKST